jgi:hypothetical protein
MSRRRADGPVFPITQELAPIELPDEMSRLMIPFH